MIRYAILSLFSLVFILFQIGTAGAQEVKALVGGTLIDGFGGEPIQDSVIIVEGDRIAAVGTVDTLPVPDGAEVISTEGMSVLPGLWEMHAHLMLNGHADYDHWHSTYTNQDFENIIMPSSAHQLLRAGITSARDLGGPLGPSLSVRDRVNAGEIPGPRLYMSGPFLQKEPYPGTESYRWGIDGADDARAKVRQLAEAGVDIIKLVDQDELTMEELQALVDEANAHDLPVIAHSHRPEEVRKGLTVGISNYEHTGFATAPRYPDDIMQMIRERVARMNRRGGLFFWTPTIEGLFNYEYVRDHMEKLDNTSWHLGLPDEIIEDIRQSFQNPDRLPYFQLTPKRRKTLATKFNQLRDAGVILLIGTDSGIPMKFHSQSTWNEIDTWVRQLGVPPIEAIRAATYWPSVAMGVENEVGTVTEGKLADIIAVKGDVLRYIALLQDVDFVMKGGEVYVNDRD